MSAKHKEIIQKVNDGFQNNDMETFLGFCTENILWQMAGDGPKKGKDTIRDWMASMEDMGPPKINTTAVISEGDSAACYGDMTMKEKGEENFYSFCDIYKFTDDKIAELRSFVVKQKPSGESQHTANA